MTPPVVWIARAAAAGSSSLDIAIEASHQDCRAGVLPSSEYREGSQMGSAIHPSEEVAVQWDLWYNKSTSVTETPKEEFRR